MTARMPLTFQEKIFMQSLIWRWLPPRPRFALCMLAAPRRKQPVTWTRRSALRGRSGVGFGYRPTGAQSLVHRDQGRGDIGAALRQQELRAQRRALRIENFEKIDQSAFEP